VLLDYHLELGEVLRIFALPFLQPRALLQLVGALLRTTLLILKAVFIGIDSVALPTGHALPPRRNLEAAPAAIAAITALDFLVAMRRIIDGVEVLLHVELLILVILLEMRECAHPPLLDELVIAGELPGDEFLRVSGGEIEVLVEEGPPDVLPLQHVLGLELDGEVGRGGLEPVYLDDVGDLDRALGQLVELLEHLDVVAWVRDGHL